MHSIPNPAVTTAFQHCLITQRSTVSIKKRMFLDGYRTQDVLMRFSSVQDDQRSSVVQKMLAVTEITNTAINNCFYR